MAFHWKVLQIRKYGNRTTQAGVGGAVPGGLVLQAAAGHEVGFGHWFSQTMLLLRIKVIDHNVLSAFVNMPYDIKQYGKKPRRTVMRGITQTFKEATTTHPCHHNLVRTVPRHLTFPQNLRKRSGWHSASPVMGITIEPLTAKRGICLVAFNGGVGRLLNAF